MNDSSNKNDFPPVSGPGSPSHSHARKVIPKIKGYRILSELGEGGMGIVYLAERLGPIQRRVALKVIKPGMDSRRVIARFEAEQHALALLDHPNIAQVYDADVTESGLPYFAMEYVKGISINEHCDREKLSIEDRLKLFLQVCEAIQHAHQKGIIHRDIKPSNILVYFEEDKAVPKIIDFGVAKAIAQPLTEQTLFTEQGQIIGTPEYMSPEQAEMTAQDIDTRTDIYSLGVILYELLTGALPFDRRSLQRAAFDEIRRIIREQDPPKPSTVLFSLGDKAKTVARSRRTEIKSLTKRLHRELEWIPLKALRKERNQRYRSASEFADDIQNYLNGSPLIAGPESAVYRLKKFARKRRAAVAAGAAIAASLIVGLVVSTVMYFQAEDARVRAVDAERIAQEQRNHAINSQQETQRANEKLVWENYVATLGVIQMRIKDGNFPRARELLENCSVAHRGWEWGRLMRQASPELLTIRTNDFDDRPVGSLHNAIFTPDERYILDDRPGLQQYSLIDLQTGQTIMKSKQYPGGGWRECTQFLPDNKYISYSSGRHTVDIIDYKKDEMIVRFDSGKGTLRSFVVSPNSKLAAGYNIVEETGQREIILWDAANATELNRFQMQAFDFSQIHQSQTEDGWWIARLISPKGRVLGFLPDNHSLVYADEYLSVLDIDTGEQKHLAPCIGWFSCYAPKSTTAAILNPSNKVELWDVAREVMVTKLKESNPTHCLTISNDGKWIATRRGFQGHLWRGDTGEYVRAFAGSVNSISFSPSGTCAITTDLSEIKIWSVLNERNLETKAVTSNNELVNMNIADWVTGSGTFSQKRHLLVTGDIEGNIYTWEVPSFKLLKRWEGHEDKIWTIAFSSDDRLLATSSRDGTVKVWDLPSGTLLYTIKDVAGKTSMGVCFSSNDKRLAVGADLQDESKVHKDKRYSEVRIFDVETGRLLFTTAQGQYGIEYLAYSPNGKWLIVGRSYDRIKGSLDILDAESGKQLLGKIPDWEWTMSVSFTPDSRYMLTVGGHLEILLWDIEQQREVWHLRNPDALKTFFHPDGRRFVAINSGSIAVHATYKGREVITFRHERSFLPASFSADGRQLIYRQDDWHMRILHSDDWTIPDKKAAFKAALRDVQQELNITP